MEKGRDIKMVMEVINNDWCLDTWYENNDCTPETIITEEMFDALKEHAMDIDGCYGGTSFDLSRAKYDGPVMFKELGIKVNGLEEN